MRVYVDLEPGFESRTLSARLVLMDGDRLEGAIFDKREVSGPSEDGDLASTFNFSLPGEKLTPTLQYALEIVECGERALPTPENPPRYPTSGFAAFGAQDVGPLRIHFVPVIAPNSVAEPDVSESRLQSYVDHMTAMYPVAKVEYTVATTPLETTTELTSTNNWFNVLNQLCNRRKDENAPKNIYYYGLFQPKSGKPEGSTNGVAYRIYKPDETFAYMFAGIGISLGDELSRFTFTHEVAHLHGRDHAPCDTYDPEASYPYSGGVIGWWGLEWPGTLRPPSDKDVMGYCRPYWISDYTYRHLAERIAHMNGKTLSGVVASRVQLPETPPRPERVWRRLIVSTEGTEWTASSPSPEAAAGEAEAARIFDAEGNELLETTVYRLRTSLPGAALIFVPEPEQGWHAIQVEGQAPLRFE